MTRHERLYQSAFIEMFRRVGLEITDLAGAKRFEDENGPNWYHARTWTESEQDDFTDWLAKRLKRARFVRPEYEASMFVMCYGWKTKQEEPNGTHDQRQTH